MKVAKTKDAGWPVKPSDPAILTTQEWVITSVLGALLIAAAVVQLVNFGDFKDNLKLLGFQDGAAAWGAAIIIAELWGAANMFKLRLSYGFRVVSAGMAILAAGFWFVLNLSLISEGKTMLSTSNFLGRFANISPGWWSVIIVTVLLFWTLYAVALTRYTLPKNGHITIRTSKGRAKNV